MGETQKSIKTSRTVSQWLTWVATFGVMLAINVSVVWPRWLPVAAVVSILLVFTHWVVRLGFHGEHRSLRIPDLRSPRSLLKRFRGKTLSDCLARLGIFLLLCPVLFSALISFYPETTLPQVYRLLLGVCLYIVVLNFVSGQKRISWLVYTLIAMGLILAFIAPISVRWNILKIPIIPDAIYHRFSLLLSDTIHPNVLAGYLLILLPFPIALLLYDWKEQKVSGRIYAGLAVLVMSAVLFLSQSRGAWLAFALILCAMISVRYRWGWLLLSLVVVTVLVLLIWFPPILDGFIKDNSFSSFEIRQEAWQRAIYMIQDFPLGVGMGLYDQMTTHFYPLFLALPGEIPHAHNIFLQVAVDLGIPGLIAWCVLIASVLLAAWRIYAIGNLTQDRWYMALGAALFFSQIALLLHGLVDAVTWGMVRLAPLVWAIWGLAIAADIQRKKTSPACTRKVLIWPVLILAIWLVVTMIAAGQSFTAYQSLDTIQPAMIADTAESPIHCDSLTRAEFLALNPGLRAAFGSFLISVDCNDIADGILPPLTPEANRADLLAYHWGRIAWNRGEVQQAAQWWRQAPGVTQLLMLQAENELPDHQNDAMNRFEAANLSASTQLGFAETLLAYTNAMRNHLAKNEFRERLLALSSYYGPGTAENHRIQGEYFVSLGNFQDAYSELSQAIAGGLSDSDTWYLLGYVMQKQNHLDGAEEAYHQALDSPIAIVERRPWYLHNLAGLMIQQGRLQEALPYQLEAAQLNRHYLYWDQLAVLYTQLGNQEQAERACKQAHQLIPTNETQLECRP